MGKIRLSLALMLLTALGVILAGRQLARRVEVERTEVDRTLLMTFADEFERQVARIDQETLDRLITLARKLETAGESEGKDLLTATPGARAGSLFRERRQIKSWSLLTSFGTPSLPDVVIEGGKVPFNPETAVTLTSRFFEDALFGTSGWVPSADGHHLFFWGSAEQGRITGVLLRTEPFLEDFLESIREATSDYYEPIRQSGEWVSLDLEKGPHLFGQNPPLPPGPASMVTSVDFANGRFWLRAWNREETRIFTDRFTLLTASLLATALALSGGLLYTSQARAWRESMERVTFVNRVSHELGTPLTNMTLNLELASRSLRSDPELAGRRLEKVREETGRLSRLVNNVLSYSRSEHHGERVPCIPDEVIADVLTQFRPALERRGMQISWQPGAPEEAVLDRDGLSQIVWNLISNVEKYAASGRWLGLATSVQDSQLLVEVQDRGEGIPLADRRKIFQAFERVHDSTSEGVSGTGLGLTISRDLARAMGGSLRVLDPKKGSAFRLTLPLQAA